MPLTLIEFAKTVEDELLRGVIETYAATSPILERLPFDDIEGNSFTYNQEESLPGIAFRGVNEGYTESVGVLNPVTEKLKIMGGDADTDKYFQRTGGKSVIDRRAADIAMKAKAAALYFTKVFFDGDEASSTKEFDGLNKRLTGNQVIPAGADGANLDDIMLQQLIDALDGPPDQLLMGKKMRRQVYNLAKNTSILTIDKDAFGRTIERYAGIPIGIIEKDNSGNEILAFDETQGASNETGSIYGVKYGSYEYLAGLQSGPPDANDLGEIDEKPVLRYRIDWDITIAMFHPRCAARLKGVLAAVN